MERKRNRPIDCYVKDICICKACENTCNAAYCSPVFQESDIIMPHHSHCECERFNPKDKR